MSAEPNRSEEVIEDYKKRKLAHSALRRIHDLIQGFEDDRAFDRRLARVGIVIILVLVALGLYFLFSGESVVVN